MEKVSVQQTDIGLLKWVVYSEYANQSDFITTAGTLYEKARFWLYQSSTLMEPTC